MMFAQTVPNIYHGSQPDTSLRQRSRLFPWQSFPVCVHASRLLSIVFAYYIHTDSDLHLYRWIDCNATMERLSSSCCFFQWCYALAAQKPSQCQKAQHHRPCPFSALMHSADATTETDIGFDCSIRLPPIQFVETLKRICEQIWKGYKL